MQFVLPPIIALLPRLPVLRLAVGWFEAERKDIIQLRHPATVLSLKVCVEPDILLPLPPIIVLWALLPNVVTVQIEFR